MTDPYRAPEVPAGVEAERRLDQRMSELVDESARQRANAARRARWLRRALLLSAAMAGLYTIAGIVLQCTICPRSQWLAGSVLVGAIATPMALFFAIGLKVPPRPGDPFGGMPNRHP